MDKPAWFVSSVIWEDCLLLFSWASVSRGQLVVVLCDKESSWPENVSVMNRWTLSPQRLSCPFSTSSWKELCLKFCLQFILTVLHQVWCVFTPRMIKLWVCRFTYIFIVFYLEGKHMESQRLKWSCKQFILFRYLPQGLEGTLPPGVLGTGLTARDWGIQHFVGVITTLEYI